MKMVSSLRSKNYTKIIEIRVPLRLYWVDDEYDGFEFGSLEKCSKYQLGLLNIVIKQLAFEHECETVAEYMRDYHNEEWRALLDKIDAETLNIPQEFLDAFKEK